MAAFNGISERKRNAASRSRIASRKRRASASLETGDDSVGVALADHVARGFAP
jgi:hypothetical protein